MSKHSLMALFSLLAAVVIGVMGFYIGRNSLPASDSSSSSTVEVSAPVEAMPPRMLKFTADPSEEIQIFSSQDLNGSIQWDMLFKHIQNVTLEIDGQAVLMEKAVADGMIDSATLFYGARQDLKNGYCTMTSVSRNGLSVFVFQYPELDLCMRYDVYETPDGKNPVIDEFNLTAPGEDHNNIRTTYRDPETGERLEKEDWGLTFEVLKTSPTGMVLNIIQEGKVQQFGNLSTRDYAILEGTYVSDAYPWMKVDIPEGETTTVTIDWTDYFGKLQPGDYTLQLNINDDTYKKMSKLIHPFTLDYTVWQEYYIPFTVA